MSKFQLLATELQDKSSSDKSESLDDDLSVEMSKSCSWEVIFSPKKSTPKKQKIVLPAKKRTPNQDLLSALKNKKSKQINEKQE